MSESVVSVSDLVKRYGDVEAVRGIGFEVQPGETFGFLGPNGAGKSTTIKILCTLANPTSGTARVAGHDVVKERDTVRRNIGLVFQDTTLDNYLTGEQNLRFHADLYGVPRARLAPRMRQVLEMVGLWDRRTTVVDTYSGGMKRRLEIARGLLHAPRVLFLDEPTVGLDPQTRSSIWEYINDLKRREDITIFLTTHYMDEAENCDRIAIIDGGRLVAIDTPENLKASVGKDRVQISTVDDPAAIKELKEHFGIDAAVHEHLVTFNVESGEQFVPRLFAELTQAIRSVSVARPGVLAMSVLFTAIFSAASIVWDREFGFLREMLVAPVSRAAIVIGKCLGGATLATCQGIVMLILAGLANVPYDPVLLLTIIGELLLLSFTLTAFGVMMAARVRQIQAFMALTQMLLMPLFFLSGALYPLNGLPAWLTVLTRFDPLTYIVDPMRHAVFTHLNITPAAAATLSPGVTWDGWRVPIGLSLGMVALMGVVLLGIAIAEFRKSELGIPQNKGDAGWLRGQTTRRRNHRRSDGGPERRQGCPDGGPEHRYESYTETPPYVSRPNYKLIPRYGIF